MTSTEAPPRAGRREWLGLAVLALPTLLTTVDINVLFLALPEISADLDASAAAQLWITDIYAFMVAGFLVTMGTLGDRIGRRKVLLAGAAVFCAASLLAAFATSTEVLIAARALLGVAGATVMPSVLALISAMFKDPKQMGTAIGLWASAIMGGVVLGPAIGGLLLDVFWWGSVFLMGVPIMLLVLIAGPALLPEDRETESERLDPVSVLLSLAALLPIVYGLKEISRIGWQSTAFGFILAGAACTVVFLQRQRVLRNPLVDLSLFRDRPLTAALTIGLLLGGILGGTGLMVTLYMQMVEGLSPLETGLWLVPPALLMIVGGNVSPMIARRVRPAVVLVVGMVIAAIGMVVIATVDGSAGLGVVITGLTIVYVGGSPIGVLLSHLVLVTAPPEKAGSASSLSSTGGELGVALGVALLGSLGTVVYRNEVELPAGLAPEAALPAGESIAGADYAADHLPAPAAADVLDAAQSAFTSSLQVVSIVVAVLFLGLAAITAVWLRQVPPTGAEPHGHAQEQEQPQVGA